MNQYNNGYQPMNPPQGGGSAPQFCPKCGAKLEQGSLFCGSCGQKAPEVAPATQPQPAYNGYYNANQGVNQPQYQAQPQTQYQVQPQQQYQPQVQQTYTPNQTYAPQGGKKVSRKEFIENYADPKLKKEIKSTSILCYVCAGITIIINIVLMDILGILAGLLLLGFALGLHISKSKACAILILILGIITFLISAAFGSYPVMWLVAGFSGVSNSSKIDKQYKQFLSNNF